MADQHAERDTDVLCHWQRALVLAEEAVGRSDPNPRVGCVITSADGLQVLGEGSTQAAGQAHAEVMALRDAAARGANVRGARVFVTLEPCAHQGRTPPCVDALIAAGVGAVHIALLDPNPQVAGRGAAALRSQGIAVHSAPQAVAEAARELNIGFLHRMQTGRPWVRVKAAMSADGRIALPSGQSQWITGETARQDGQRFRQRAGALLTGSGTVRADDPRLTVRLAPPPPMQPRCVVVDGRLQTPPTAQVLAHPGGVLIAHALLDGPREAALREARAELLALPDQNDPAHVDLPALLAHLGSQGVNELHVEAGAGLAGALARCDAIDDWLLYIAPLWLGAGLGPLQMAPPSALAHAPRGQWLNVTPLGEDLRALMRMHPPPTILAVPI